MIEWREDAGRVATRTGDVERARMARRCVARVRENGREVAELAGDALVYAVRSKAAPDEVDVFDAVIRRYGEDHPTPTNDAIVAEGRAKETLARGRRVHYLKAHPGPFQAVRRGEKTHEVRRNDRGFKAGDTLVLKEWVPYGCSAVGEHAGCEGGHETGEREEVFVTHVTEGGTFGLPADLCVMSIVTV